MPDVMRNVGRYEILREIGRGGMARVYLARQTDLARPVALKELAALHTSDPSVAQRFLRESRLAGSFSHPNIVTVHDYFEHEGTPYIAMEYLERGSFRPFVGRLPLVQIAGVLEGVLAGLGHAEHHEVVHRDLKPENLMVTGDGRVKIADFGIAKATRRLQTEAFRTATGTTIGTPLYMAPEQAMAQEISPATDLYSVGCIAFELVTGKVPFADMESPVAILFHHVSELPPAATALNPNVPEPLSDWIARLLAKQPNERPQSAAEAWDDLEEIVIAVAGPRWIRHARLRHRPDELPPDAMGDMPAPLGPLPSSQVSVGGPYTPPPSRPVPESIGYLTFMPDSEPRPEAPPDAGESRTPPEVPAVGDTDAPQAYRTPPPEEADSPRATASAGAGVTRVSHDREPSGPVALTGPPRRPPPVSDADTGGSDGGAGSHPPRRASRRSRRPRLVAAAVSFVALLAAVGVLLGRDGETGGGGAPPAREAPRLKWKFPTDAFMASAPVVTDGRVIFGSQNSNVYAVDAETGRRLWETPTGKNVVSSPAVAGQTVYIGSLDGGVYALDSATGAQRWRFAGGKEVESSPAVSDGIVYVGNNDGRVHAIRASTGREVWRFETGQSVSSSPAIADGLVYVGSRDGYFYALDARTGRRRWRYETDDQIWSSPTVADGIVYVGSNDRKLYAFAAETGKKYWNRVTGDVVSSSPVVAFGNVYVGSFDDHVYAYNATTGEERWRFKTGDKIFSSPTVADGVVYVGSHDRKMYAIDAATGRKRWEYKTGALVGGASPMVSDGTLYFGSDDGNLYALSLPPS